MDIAIIGYGKMGKEIERIAVDRGHHVILKISRSNEEDFTIENLQKCDVAIEFTVPESGEKNALLCLDAGIPLISGTTAWNSDKAKAICLEKNGGMIHATNFSLGVNIFFELNSYLATLMNSYQQYDVNMKEIHHTAKKDAPSGTAITIAQGIIDRLDRKNKWVLDEAKSDTEISIVAQRMDPAPGTHIVTYASEIDEIEIIHTAKNRIGFALGAVIAAEWILHKKGVFTMKNVLFD